MWRFSGFCEVERLMLACVAAALVVTGLDLEWMPRAVLPDAMPAAAECGVDRFVLISTDKAANPASVISTTKRAPEMVISALGAEHTGTKFMAVRFGNVLDSSCSVIPKFKKQIARGGPVTVTHPEIIRYFMTIPKAARLVLQAAAIGESGQVLVLDMGDTVKIFDLVRKLIRLAGHTLDEIAIEFTGLRAGEKLYEELLADGNATLATRIPNVRVARMDDQFGAVRDLLRWLLQARESPLDGVRPDAEVRARLAGVVEGFRP